VETSTDNLNVRDHLTEARALIERLRAYRDGPFPFDDARLALELKAEITPLLLEVLNQVSLDLEGTLSRGEWFLANFSYYTLSYFREGSALEPLLKICNEPIELADGLLGDSITEDLHRLLASIYNGDYPSFKAIILNDRLDEFVRGAVLRTFLSLYRWKAITRDELVTIVTDILDNLTEDDPVVLEEIADACYILRDEELFAKLTAIYQPEEFGLNLDGMKKGKGGFSFEADQRFAHFETSSYYDLPLDPITTMSAWHCFTEKKTKRKGLFQRILSPMNEELDSDFDLEANLPYERTAPKLGRNDPCHCQSGKKYKKCCLPKEDEIQMAELQKTTLDAQFVKDVEKLIYRGRREYPDMSAMIDYWLKAWDLLKAKVDPSLPSLRYMKLVYKFHLDLDQFLYDLEAAFFQLAEKDKTAAEKGLSFFGEVSQCGIYSHSGDQRFLKSKMAGLLFHAGRGQEADALASSIIDEWPSFSEGYICKGELAKLRSAPLTEVLHWFEKAKNVDVSNQDEYLDEWIEDLKKEILALQEKT